MAAEARAEQLRKSLNRSDMMTTIRGAARPLQILMVHNRYRIRGGEDVSTDAEIALLREYGHNVHVITKDNRDLEKRNAVGLAANSVWSRRSRREVWDILRGGGFDVMHVQNFLPQFSPSIYYAAREAGVPVIQTLRNYRLLCPTGTFHRDGRTCEACLGRSVAWPGIRYSCYRDSRMATAAVAGMTAVHHIMRTWTQCVTQYIALTRFARDKMVEGGFPAEKIAVKPNFVFPDPGYESEKEDFALYVGRLSPEKGIATLLRAWQQTQFPLKIVGEGPLRQSVEAAAEQLPHVEYLGRKTLSETYALLGKACLLVFPSEGFETFGRVMAEAFSRGTPVVASQLGAAGELVDSLKTGLHFTPGDADDLAEKVKWMVSRPVERAQMGREARLVFENRYSSSQNHAQLVEIYLRAIEQA